MSEMDQRSASPRGQMARKIIIDLSIMTVIGIVLAFIGPFGSFALPLPYRLVSWVGFAWVGYAIYSPMNFVVDRLYVWLDLPRPFLWAFGVALATIPMTAFVWALGFVPRPVPWPTLEQGLTSYFYVFLVGGGITAFFYMIESRKIAAENAAANAVQGTTEPETNNEPAPKAEPETSAPFFDRIPKHLGTDLIALEMEDHYVRAHTTAGSDLVLMRLRDAIAELGDLEGKLVHRSWWVARAAVEGSRKDGRNLRLMLTGGLEAPVSRANVTALKEAGWF